MKLAFDPAELALQDELRSFIAQQSLLNRPYRTGTEDEERWARASLEQGWAAYQWPAEFGGTG